MTVRETATIPPSRDRAGMPLRPDEAVLFVAAIFIAYLLAARALGPVLTPLMLLALQWVVIAAPVIALLLIRGLPLAATLRLRAPRPRHWLGTVVFAAGMTAVAALFMAAQEALLSDWPPYAERMEHWSEVLTAETPGALATLVFGIAVTPAICEELLFRGLLTRALAPWMSRAGTCVTVGLLFGLFHGDVLQLVPAALIGMALTWLVLVTDSLWTAVLFHLLFNVATIASNLAAHRLGEDAVSPAVGIGVCAVVAAIFLPLSLHWLRPRAAAINSPTGVNP